LLFKIVTSSCEDRIGYDISLLKPIDSAYKIKDIPAVFIVGKDDKLVLPGRVKEIYDIYKGPKYYHLVNGEHQNARSEDEILKVFGVMQEFFTRNFPLKGAKKLNGRQATQHNL
jgi:fermentation-respiration switch protein FrsA (DUF1100 family)